jgi:hypothetical protein
MRNRFLDERTAHDIDTLADPASVEEADLGSLSPLHPCESQDLLNV